MASDRNDIRELDAFYQPCGPCAFCGHEDKRHRLWDTVLDAPESDEECAREYGLSVEHVRAVRRIRPYQEPGKQP